MRTRSLFKYNFKEQTWFVDKVVIITGASSGIGKACVRYPKPRKRFSFNL